MKFGADYNHKYQLAAVLYVVPVLVSTGVLVKPLAEYSINKILS